MSRRVRSTDRVAAQLRQRLAPILDDAMQKHAPATAAPTPQADGADEASDVAPLSSSYDAATPDVELVADVDEAGDPRYVVPEGARRGLRTPRRRA